MVQYSEKRASERTTYKVPVTVEDLEDGFIYRARMVNYSEYGMYLETDVFLKLGAAIYIEIEDSPYAPPSSTAPAKVPTYFRAKIRWQKELKDSFFKFGYGVNTISVEDALNLQAKKFQVKQDLREHPRRSYPKPVFFTSQNQYYKGLINNISRCGVFIETRDRFTVTQIIKLVIPGTKIDKGVMLKGEVVRFDQSGVGVKFKSILKSKSAKHMRKTQ
jgi:Tfp pilus assembly protein PilZ